MINQGFEIRTSDFAGGVLEVATSRKEFSDGQTYAACVVSFALPPVGDAMLHRDVLVIVFDALTYPFSSFWAPWFNLAHGLEAMENVRGNVTFEKLGNQETRLRISLTGVAWDVTDYPRDIRRLQDLVGRQLLLKKADDIGQEPASGSGQESVPPDATRRF